MISSAPKTEFDKYSQLPPSTPTAPEKSPKESPRKSPGKPQGESLDEFCLAYGRYDARRGLSQLRPKEDSATGRFFANLLERCRNRPEPTLPDLPSWPARSMNDTALPRCLIVLGSPGLGRIHQILDAFPHVLHLLIIDDGEITHSGLSPNEQQSIEERLDQRAPSIPLGEKSSPMRTTQEIYAGGNQAQPAAETPTSNPLPDDPMEHALQTGASITCVIGNSDQAQASIAQFITTVDALFLECAWFLCQHQGFLPRLASDLPEFLQQFVARNQAGFLEDEEFMLNNFTEKINLPEPWSIALNKPSPRKNTWICLIGNGPSLTEEVVNQISNLRDQMILVSCGSTLWTLLHLGITPDFHVEVERLDAYKNLHQLPNPNLPGQPKPILLSTTTSLHLPHFSRRVHFFRDTADSRFLGLGSELKFQGAGPLAVNGAFATFMVMGFHRFLLVGNDFGTRDATYPHAANSIYITDPENIKVNVLNVAAASTSSNFGGTLRSMTAYQHGRNQLSAHLKSGDDLTMFNATDGAHLEGTIPILLDEFAPDGNIYQKEHDIDAVLAQTIDSFEFLKSLNLDALQCSLPALEHCVQEFRSIIEQAKATQASFQATFFAVHVKRIRWISEQENQQRFATIINSVFSSLRIAWIYLLYLEWSRPDDDTTLQQFKDSIFEQLLAHLEEIEQRLNPASVRCLTTIQNLVGSIEPGTD